MLILELEWFPTVSPTEMFRSTYIDAEFHVEYIFDVFQMNWEPYDSQNIKTLRGVDLEKSRKA